jgi:alpha-beta hydrolase superfamily lysophospholipase
MLRGLALVAGTLAVAAAAAHAAARPFPHVTGCVRADFPSAGTNVRAERCGPASGARAVIVLHGCGGFSTFDHRVAADLPRYGISTLYVDYFGPTPPPGSKGYCNVWTRRQDDFPTWERVAKDAAHSLRARFAHVGAVGWSLGAGVALSAAEDLQPFDALASFSGLAYPSAVARASELPRRSSSTAGRATSSLRRMRARGSRLRSARRSLRRSRCTGTAPTTGRVRKATPGSRAPRRSYFATSSSSQSSSSPCAMRRAVMSIRS